MMRPSGAILTAMDIGDNPNGTNPDAFITDATQWSDEDGDGYGDNPAGRLYDQFPQNPTQWLDEDGDGLGDNQSGTDADPSSMTLTMMATTIRLTRCQNCESW